MGLKRKITRKQGKMCAIKYKFAIKVMCDHAFLQPLVKKKHRASFYWTPNNVNVALQEHFKTGPEVLQEVKDVPNLTHT